MAGEGVKAAPHPEDLHSSPQGPAGEREEPQELAGGEPRITQVALATAAAAALAAALAAAALALRGGWL